MNRPFEGRTIKASGFAGGYVTIELKSVKRIVQAYEIQLVNYLVATKKPIGLIINFGESKAEIKRKVRELKKY